MQFRQKSAFLKRYTENLIESYLDQKKKNTSSMFSDNDKIIVKAFQHYRNAQKQ